jgi:proteasome lid subunit RPN8/RPN11
MDFGRPFRDHNIMGLSSHWVEILVHFWQVRVCNGAIERRMTLTIDDVEPLMEAMAEWAMAAYPNEGCGLLVERQRTLEVVCCENLQDELHQLDPARYPRTAQTAYNLDPRVFCEVEDSGGRVRGIFHSHPDRGAYFSDEDSLCALGGDVGGQPVLPGVDYVVLSARRDGVDDRKLFHWESEERVFREST